MLLVEDEPKLNLSIKKGLEQQGYAVDNVFDGTEAELLATSEDYDLIILDVLLPGQDGYAVCRKVRDFGIETPILFLTAKDALEDKVNGLNLGADDYLVKPFAFEELSARIRALLRRPKKAIPELLASGNLVLNTLTHQVTLREKEITLTLKEFQLLEYLLRNKNQVITREQLVSHVWDQHFDSFSNIIDAHIKNLRKKLKGDYAKKLETVRGVGYTFRE